MPKKYYTEEEVVLCAYNALYGSGLLAEKRIAKFGARSEGSVKMKVQNIAAMLDDKGITRSLEVSAPSGMPPGESGRETDWPLVEQLAASSKAERWQQCKSILSGGANGS